MRSSSSRSRPMKLDWATGRAGGDGAGEAGAGGAATWDGGPGTAAPRIGALWRPVPGEPGPSRPRAGRAGAGTVPRLLVPGLPVPGPTALGLAVTRLEVGERLTGPRGHLGPPGLPSVHGGEGHAEQVSELLLAQGALGPQLAEPRRRRFGRAPAGRLAIHARSLRCGPSPSELPRRIASGDVLCSRGSRAGEGRHRARERADLSAYVDVLWSSAYADEPWNQYSRSPRVRPAPTRRPGSAPWRRCRQLTERLEILQVDNARALGWSWQQIAERLGVTKQTVHRKHGRRTGRR